LIIPYGFIRAPSDLDIYTKPNGEYRMDKKNPPVS
jgi:hypothetical protein